MKRFTKILIAIFLTLAAVGIGLGLPLAVSEYGDKKLDASGQPLDKLGVSLGLNGRGSISLEQKFEAISSGDIYAVASTGAKYMGSDTAVAKAVEWLEDFLTLGIPSVDPKSANRTESAVPAVLTDRSGSGVSFFVWRVSVSDENGSAILVIDDETGSLLAVTYDAADTETEISDGQTQGKINLHVPITYICDKLGCKLIEINVTYAEADYSEYIVAISFDGGKTVISLPLFGNLRSYSINLEGVQEILSLNENS